MQATGPTSYAPCRPQDLLLLPHAGHRTYFFCPMQATGPTSYAPCRPQDLLLLPHAGHRTYFLCPMQATGPTSSAPCRPQDLLLLPHAGHRTYFFCPMQATGPTSSAPCRPQDLLLLPHAGHRTYFFCPMQATGPTSSCWHSYTSRIGNLPDPPSKQGSSYTSLICDHIHRSTPVLLNHVDFSCTIKVGNDKRSLADYRQPGHTYCKIHSKLIIFPFLSCTSVHFFLKLSIHQSHVDSHIHT